MKTGSWTPSSAAEVLQDIPGFSLSGWRILNSGRRRIGIIRCIAGNYLTDCDISGKASHRHRGEVFFWLVRRPQPGSCQAPLSQLMSITFRLDRPNNILIPLDETDEDCLRDIQYSQACVQRAWVTWLFLSRKGCNHEQHWM